MMISRFYSQVSTALVYMLLATLSQAKDGTSTTTASIPDAQDADFIGYCVGLTTIERLTAGLPWVTSGTYAGDCQTESKGGRCIFKTACYDNTLYFDNGLQAVCDDQFSCVDFTIFQTSPFGLPSAHNVNCRGVWAANTVYRDSVALTTITTPTESQASSQPTGSLSTKRQSATSTGQHQSLPTTDNQTTTPDNINISSNNPDSNDNSISKIWIIGPVLGGLALLVCAVALYLFLRRRRQHRQQGQEQEKRQGGGGYYGESERGRGDYTNNYNHHNYAGRNPYYEKADLGSNPLVELPASPTKRIEMGIAELPG